MKEIKTVKDLINNEELVQQITEDITEIPEDTEVTYEVWAIGYDSEDQLTDADLFMKDFRDPDEAVEYAKQLTLADIVERDAEEHEGEELPAPEIVTAYLSIEVETVIEDDEDSTMNIGTVYKRDLWLDGEYGEEEDAQELADIQEDAYSEVVPVTSEEYELLEDGSLEIDCEILKDYNKNDIVQIWFTDEDNKSILTYKIISKTTANKYICEFIY